MGGDFGIQIEKFIMRRFHNHIHLALTSPLGSRA